VLRQAVGRGGLLQCVPGMLYPQPPTAARRARKREVATKKCSENGPREGGKEEAAWLTKQGVRDEGERAREQRK